jgi:ABC-type phosphate transport system substrate-binding protein
MTKGALAARACVPLLAVAMLSGSSDARREDNATAALAIVVNRGNPVDDLTLAELRRIFMFDTQTWPNGHKITVVLREKGQPERDEAIRLVCGLSGHEYDRHLLFQTFRGSIGWGPRSILSASAMLRFVFNVPGAIGYVGADEVDDTTKVLRLGGLRPSDPRYPLRRARVN